MDERKTFEELLAEAAADLADWAAVEYDEYKARRIHALNLRAIANAELEMQFGLPAKPHEGRE